MKTVYVAFDGKQFETESECRSYEAIINGIKCWDVNGHEVSAFTDSNAWVLNKDIYFLYVPSVTQGEAIQDSFVQFSGQVRAGFFVKNYSTRTFMPFTSTIVNGLIEIQRVNGNKYFL